MTKLDIAQLASTIATRAFMTDCPAERSRCRNAVEQLDIAKACKPGSTRRHYVEAALHSFQFGR